MLKNLDLLLNMDVLEHEKDWDFIEAVQDVDALEHSEKSEDKKETSKESSKQEKENE